MKTVYCVFQKNYKQTDFDSIHESYKEAEIRKKLLEQKQNLVEEKYRNNIYILEGKQ